MHAMKRNSRRGGVRRERFGFAGMKIAFGLARRALRMVGHTGREI